MVCLCVICACMSAWGLYNQQQDAAAPANQRGEIIWRSGTLQHRLTHLDSAPFFLLYAEAKCGQWAVTLPDSPENVLLEDENTAGSLTSLTAGEINRVATTQLPTAVTTAVCQPRQMHKRRTSFEYGCCSYFFWYHFTQCLFFFFGFSLS